MIRPASTHRMDMVNVQRSRRSAPTTVPTPIAIATKHRASTCRPRQLRHLMVIDCSTNHPGGESEGTDHRNGSTRGELRKRGSKEWMVTRPHGPPRCTIEHDCIARQLPRTREIAPFVDASHHRVRDRRPRRMSVHAR